MSDTTNPTLITLPPGAEALRGRDRLAMLPPLFAMNGEALNADDIRLQSTTNDNGSTNYCQITLSRNQYKKLDDTVFEDDTLRVKVIIEVPSQNTGFKKNSEIQGDFVSALLAQAKR